MKVLITAGPTWEFLDPVRIITSPATATIGFLLADQFLKDKKNKVTLICGPVPHIPSKATIKKIVSAEDMFKLIKKISHQFDVIIMSAAVSDFKPKKTYPYKIKRKENKKLLVELIPTPDILSYLSTHKEKNQILVGFSLESHNLLKNTLKKFANKKVDLIVANKLPAFGNNKINGYFIYNNNIEKFENSTKKWVALKIKNIVYKLKMILR